MINSILVIFLPSIISAIQLNLYFTDSINEIQHNCFRLINFVGGTRANQQLMLYCMMDSMLKYEIENKTFFPKFTFDELSKRNITGEQLYFWSAPIDLIEDYQIYLNQLSTSTTSSSSLSTNIFYNCTLPRFGLVCEYEIESSSYLNSVSLQAMLQTIYRSYQIPSTELTCYIHLECDRGPTSLCLDWTEICDGRIDCSNNGIDEKDCWQLEINECSFDEFRCMNGQCIPKAFLFDGIDIPDCLDQCDAHGNGILINNRCFNQESSFKCEDVKCTNGGFITSSCDQQRSDFIMKLLYSIKDPAISDDCWSAYKNLTLMPTYQRIIYPEDCKTSRNASKIKEICPDMLFIPSVPILSHETYLAYRKKDLENPNCLPNLFPYTCFNDSHYATIVTNKFQIIFNRSLCVHLKEKLPIDSPYYTRLSWLEDLIKPALLILKKSNLISNSSLCNRASMYRCRQSSSCISIHRLMDEIEDCPYNDDENLTQINNTHALRMILENRVKIETFTFHSYDSLDLDTTPYPYRWRRETNTEYSYIRRHISFQTICDGYNELIPILLDGRNETDETECEQWSCSNIYTSCNGYFNCLHGEDEINCHSHSVLSPMNCSLNQYLCISIHTKEFICLSSSKINDGFIDCVGANDEPFVCYRDNVDNRFSNFYCQMNNLTRCIPRQVLCDGIKHCDDEIDEYFCGKNLSKNYLYEIFSHRIKYPSVDLLLNRLDNIKRKSMTSSLSQTAYCHRGFAVQIDSTKSICFCPPSFYGDRCQYQNQRVSLTLQFRTSSNSWEISFAISISLIDNSHQRLIHSHEQLTYLPIRECHTKFHFYLLYSTKPKDSTKEYFIHIDIYEKVSLNHRTSLLYPIEFPFLPVHRLAFIIDIPSTNDSLTNCITNNPCLHGQCLRYYNGRQNPIFCRCDRGWSGRDCSIRNTCTCSSDSLYLGMTHHNRSVCVCSLHKFGPRCLLTNSICLTNKTARCFNGGECIPRDVDIQSNEKYTCVCPTGYKGKQCEFSENKLILSFGKDLVSTQSIFLHFILLESSSLSQSYQRTTTFRTIPYKQKSIPIYYSQPFHLLFIEFQNKNYYLTSIRNESQLSTTATINHFDRCPHINELFNKTFIEMHLIRRIKYYHLPCRMSAYNLSCFYDEIHLCLCQTHRGKRVANCFEFNHSQTFDCQGRSVCENDAYCFQDSPACPRRSICVCRPCFYGTYCQFSTTAFSLSLDAILGYHIQPTLRLTQQPALIQISILFSMILIVIGLMNSLCVMITFKERKLCEVGSAIYLLTASITTLLTTIIFGMKFWILIEAQRGAITDRIFLRIQCYFIDFLFSCCLHMDQWLTACIAVERAVITIKNVYFNKTKSKQWAKIVILILFLFIFGTNIHDPISRQLVDEKNELAQRIWCIASYSSSLKIYNYTINTFHFIAPFLLNFFSVIILFTKKTHQQSNIRRNRSYRDILLEHKHLVLGPIVSITLSLPRILLSFIFKCMKSTSDSWLYLFGYLISLSPYMLTFVVFILPSKFYMNEYRQAIRQIQNRLKRWTDSILNRLLFFQKIRISKNNRVHPM